jgi:DNA-binding transcriptional LysR family regulator
MAQTESWDTYRSFLAVVRHGSLSAAARALGLTQPTLGRHVQALEARLGTRLFTRSPGGLLPTEVARALVPQAEAMAAAASALARAATGARDEVRGLVRVTASEVVSAEVLPAILRDLRRAHPGLDIALVATNRVEDVLRRDVDVAVRMTQPAQGALLAQPIGKIELGLFAHADYLARHGTPLSPADLRRHALVGFDAGTPYYRSMAEAGFGYTGIEFALRTDSDLTALAALRAGFGITGCQLPLAARDRALVRILPDISLPPLGIWVVMHEDLAGMRRTRVVFDALVTGLRAYVGKVEK